jgi:septal ring factor EnvC (AmiA/AmiB activator)
MSNQPLNQQIRALTAALQQTSSADAETRSVLTGLAAEIARLAEHHADASVTDRLEQLAVRFEADHPAVGTALRQAIDSLSKAGI